MIISAKMIDLFNYRRRSSSPVQVGDLQIGGDAPIRIQSMTTTNTNDTEACVEQAEKIIKAGGELVRLTTQGRREAENLKNINAQLRADGFNTPLVADVHFNANVADVAALYAEKVRVNPGNYVDPARVFKKIEYTDAEYADELKKLEDRFVPFLNICKEHHTAVRIGVESCMEFLRICKKEQFDNVVISIKASNTVIMVRTVRLLVDEMDRNDMHYPLHLGVTEAGEGEDGRIKSAVGIGALLADGIGDTIRVSLSEEPEAEIPVARHLVDYITKREGHLMVPATASPDFNWLRPERRKTRAAGGIGGSNVPVVIASLPNGQTPTAVEFGADTTPDYIYCGSSLPANRKEGQKYIVDFNAYTGAKDTYPIFPYNATPFISSVKADVKFLVLQLGAPSEEYLACLKAHPEVVVIAVSNQQNKLGEQRALTHELWINGLFNPVVFAQMYRHSTLEKADFQLEAATEYISCPGCGRTLYDLRSTIAKIKAATAHMKGLKIGIMGCIVNGPGEMADADYGYVGAGPGKISLYKQKMCVEKAIPESEAVEHLLRFIEEDMKKK